MKATDIPASISTPFANGGTKNSIPVPSQIATDPGLASYTDGFPPATFTDIAAGGVPPYGADFNGILYALSSLIRWQNSGGNFPYDASFSTAIGGYPKGASVSNSTGDGFWLSTADDNTTDPSSDTSGKWVPINNAGTATISLAGSNVTLIPAQYEKRVLILTGSLTANVQLTFPKIAGTWTIENQTTGGYTVSALTSGGAVITLAPSGSSSIYCDGTNMLWQIPFATNAQSLAGTATNVAANPAGVAAYVAEYALPLHGAADNSNELGGHPPSYYAFASALNAYLTTSAASSTYLAQANLGSAIAALSAGAIGTYAFLGYSAGASPGTTVSASTLDWASTSYDGGHPSGTWELQGYYGGNVSNSKSVWKRVA